MQVLLPTSVPFAEKFFYIFKYNIIIYIYLYIFIGGLFPRMLWIKRTDNCVKRYDMMPFTAFLVYLFNIF